MSRLAAACLLLVAPACSEVQSGPPRAAPPRPAAAPGARPTYRAPDRAVHAAVAEAEDPLREDLARLAEGDRDYVARLRELHGAGPVPFSADHVRKFAEALLDACSDPAATVRRGALEVLASLPPRDVRGDPFTMLFFDPDPRVRRAAVAGRARHGVGPYWRFVLRASEDQDPAVRCAAAAALTEVSNGDAEGRLLALLADPSPDVVAAAAEALAAAPRPLPASALDPACRSERTEARRAAARVLGSLSAPEAAERLVGLARDASTDVRAAAFAALGRSDVPTPAGGVELLWGVARARDAPGAERAAAVAALAGARDGPGALALLDALGQDEAPVVRLAAARAAAARAHPRGYDLLAELAEHPDPATRHAADAALRELTGLPSPGAGAPSWRRRLPEVLERAGALSGADLETRIGAVLRRVEAGADPRAAARELAALGPAATLPLVRMLEQGAEGPREEALAGAAALLHRGRLRELADARSAVAEDPVAARRVLLRIAGEAAAAADLPLLVELAAAAPHPGVARAFGDALARLLVRDPAALDELSRRWHELPRGLVPDAVRGLGAAGDPAAVPLLARELGPGPFQALVVAEIGRLAPAAPQAEARRVANALRPLLTSEEGGVARAAALAAGRLRDEDAVPALVAALAEGDEGRAAAAGWALREIARFDLGAGAAPWAAWAAAEREWLATEADAAILDLRSNRAEVVADALRRMAARRLGRERLADAVAALLGHPEAHLRLLACRTLRELRASAGMDALVAALEDPSPEVRHTAWEALRAITGRSLPAAPGPWRELARR